MIQTIASKDQATGTTKAVRVIDADELVRKIQARRAKIKAKIGDAKCSPYFPLGELKTCDWILEAIDGNSV